MRRTNRSQIPATEPQCICHAGLSRSGARNETRYGRVTAWLSLFLIIACAFPTARSCANADQSHRPRLGRRGTHLSLMRCCAWGNFPTSPNSSKAERVADDVTPCFPSLTAPGFASLWTGAPPRITGISGNRVPRLPRSQFTILESSAGFNNALLQAEPLWASAERAGRRVVVTHVPFGGDKSELGVHLQGYRGIAGRDGIVSGRSKPKPAQSWENLPSSVVPPVEITFTIGASTFYGLFIDDPSDPQKGYDTLLVTNTRSGKQVTAKLKSQPAGPGGELFWSKPIERQNK